MPSTVKITLDFPKLDNGKLEKGRMDVEMSIDPNSSSEAEVVLAQMINDIMKNFMREVLTPAAERCGGVVKNMEMNDKKPEEPLKVN